MLNLPDLGDNKKTGQKLTKHAKSCLIRALNLARDLKAEEIETIHLLYSLSTERGSMGASLLLDMGIKSEQFPFPTILPTKKIPNQPKDTISLPFSADLKASLTRAYLMAHKLNYPYVGTEHLAYAIIESSEEPVKKILSKAKTNIPPMATPNDPLFSLLPDFFSKNQKNKNKPAPISFIEKFCLNLNKETQEKNEPIIGREKEVTRLINILSRKNKNNPLLIGDPGVGKTALVSRLASLINTGRVPSFLAGKKIMNLDVASLIAGTSFRGEFESRLKEIITEASENQDVIIFIDEIHNIVGAGNVAGSLDLANILKPALSQGKIQLIGATTLQEYKRHIEKDAALERRFQIVTVSEPNATECKKILLGIKKIYENYHNIVISDENVELIVDLSDRYISGRFFPDKAIDVLDEVSGSARAGKKMSDLQKNILELEKEKQDIEKEKERLVSKEKYEEAIGLRAKEKELIRKIKNLKEKQQKTEKSKPINIGKKDIMRTVAQISHIPEEKIAEEKNLKIINIAKTLESKIIGQKEALEKISSVLIRSQFGISDSNRPLGSFLFWGPPGSGKTLSAKVIAQEFFASENSLIKIDMSEFMERHSVSALIGSPAGYVGYGEGGRLTEKVRRNPHSVLLFDEVEKAHPDVTNLLLQILEDGILTDAEGTLVSFKNTIVILTSNAETESSTPKMGFKSENASLPEGDQKELQKELGKFLRPELLNRLDYIVSFKALSQKDIQKIAELEMEALKKRLESKNIHLNVAQTALNFIAQKCFSENQGARSVRKNIQETVEKEIARMILEDKIKKNTIAIAFKNKRLIFSS